MATIALAACGGGSDETGPTDDGVSEQLTGAGYEVKPVKEIEDLHGITPISEVAAFSPDGDRVFVYTFSTEAEAQTGFKALPEQGVGISGTSVAFGPKGTEDVIAVLDGE